MRLQCPVCKKIFKSHRTYRQHELRTRACPRVDNTSIQPLIVDDPSPPDVVQYHVTNHSDDEPCIFGHEIIDPMLSELTNGQIASLMHYPEDALTQDLPNLIFFNLDYPDNQTLSWVDNLCVFGLKSQREPRAGGKWVRHDVLGVLKVIAHYMRKLIDKYEDEDVMSCLDRAKVLEYIKAINEGKDIVISKFCPYHGQVERGVIDIQRMLDRLTETIIANSKLRKDDWVRTKQYAVDYLDE